MNLSLWIWVGLAVVAAWVVGAYGRLLRLREKAEQARNSLRKHLLRCREIAGSATEGPTYAVLDDMRQIAALAEQWGKDASRSAVPPELGVAIDRAAQGVMQLRQQPEDLAGALMPPELLSSWESLVADIAARRMRYNVHVAELNEALLQIPASLLARITMMQTWESL